MSQGTPLTKEFFLEVMQGVNGQFEGIHDQFKAVNGQFKTVNDQFAGIDGHFRQVHEKLREHDDLLEMIASEVSGTQNLINELVPTKKDHETRITRLERGLTKLILKS
jgi:archaellum component FlaC